MTAIRTASPSVEVVEVWPGAYVDPDAQVEHPTDVGRVRVDERRPPIGFEVELRRARFVHPSVDRRRPEAGVQSQELVDAGDLAGGITRARLELDDEHARAVDGREQVLELHPVAPEAEGGARCGGARAPR